MWNVNYFGEYFNSVGQVSSQLDKRQNNQKYVIDKDISIRSFEGYMLNRINSMFEYSNLPDTIPVEIFQNMLFLNGTCYFTQYEKDYYVFVGSFGGEPDVYYRPTKYIVANPALKMSKEFALWDDGVLCRNDVLWMGLYPLISRYATLLAENIITLRTADIMLRVLALLTAPDDKTKEAANLYLKDLELGKLGVIAENRFFDGIKMQSPPSNNGSYLTQFIELHQYLTGSFFNEIGLTANFNMKREAISTGEASLSEDSLLPLITTMLNCRKDDIQKINEKYGLNIKIEFSSAWAENEIERALQMDKIAAEASQLDTSENLGDSEEPASQLDTSENLGDSEEPASQLDTSENLGDSEEPASQLDTSGLEVKIGINGTGYESENRDTSNEDGESGVSVEVDVKKVSDE